MIIATNDTIKDLVEEHIQKYGNDADLNCIDVSRVTNMKLLFQLSKFNGNISEWSGVWLNADIHWRRWGSCRRWKYRSHVKHWSSFRDIDFKSPHQWI